MPYNGLRMTPSQLALYTRLLASRFGGQGRAGCARGPRPRAALRALAAVYNFAGPEGPNQIAVISCILAFVSGYQIGFGPMTWLILSEVFPLRIRSAAVSIGTLANFTSNLLVTLLFEAERVSLGESALFGQFAIIAAAATLFTYNNVFETRGLSLEDIEKKLKIVVDGDGDGGNV